MPQRPGERISLEVAWAWPDVVLTREIAPPVGMADFVPVALDGERATPVAVSPADGLVALARASGFALVPAGCEGFPEEGRIEVAAFAGGSDMSGATPVGVRQEQFLDVVGRDEAQARFRGVLRLRPLGEETLPLARCRGRVLARNVVARFDAPGFDRSSVDGFAVRAEDLEGAAVDAPRLLRLTGELLTPGVAPGLEVPAGGATAIATGAMIPRGADAVAMIESTDPAGDGMIEVRQAIPPGAGISAAGSDIAAGETAARKGLVLGSREIAVLAAIGEGQATVFRRPKVAILSTGDELVAPDAPVGPGQVFGQMLVAAVEELGCEAAPFGVAPDDLTRMCATIDAALAGADAVILSGGSSRGGGDVAYRAVARFRNPGVVVHGVALKPGKPMCLAVTNGKPVVILPGCPTSATFTFHEFVAPVLRAFAGLPPPRRETANARPAVKLKSEFGRTAYTLVSLIETPEGGLVAYPVGKGPGAVTEFSAADGFLAAQAGVETVAAGAGVEVTRIGSASEPADLTFIGSHCVGLDFLIGRLAEEGVRAKSISVGSTGGLAAARRGECDVAGVHLMDPATGEYNRPFLDGTLTLHPGYRRMQGVVARADDARFAGKNAATAIDAIAGDRGRLMANRNAGSGTRLLIDRLLGGRRPPGYSSQLMSPNAVAAAVAQGRADWGVAIDTVAKLYGLRFLPLQDEHYDFVIPAQRLSRAPVRKFLALLADPETRAALARLGLAVCAEA